MRPDADAAVVVRLIREAEAAAARPRDLLVSADRLEELASAQEAVLYSGLRLRRGTLLEAAAELRVLAHGHSGRGR